MWLSDSALSRQVQSPRFDSQYTETKNSNKTPTSQNSCPIIHKTTPYPHENILPPFFYNLLMSSADYQNPEWIRIVN